MICDNVCGKVGRQVYADISGLGFTSSHCRATLSLTLLIFLHIFPLYLSHTCEKLIFDNVCGTVGRQVSFDMMGMGFKSSHDQSPPITVSRSI